MTGREQRRAIGFNRILNHKALKSEDSVMLFKFNRTLKILPSLTARYLELPDETILITITTRRHS